MERRVFGWTGESVPVIGQGTWQMEGDKRAGAIEALRRGLDLGLTHVDTAELYGSGKVEEIVAEAIAGRRDEIFLVSKVMPSNASRKGTIQACERSLKRLKTDRLDVYLLHWPGSHPLEDTIAAFEELVSSGKIRYWGVSNFDTDELDEALRIAGPKRIACNQVLYHLGERAIEHRVVPWCEKHDVAVMGYSPFGAGHFPPGDKRASAALEGAAKRAGMTPRQLALRFLTRRKSLFAIPKASRAAHVEDNAGGGAIDLAPDILKEIDEAFGLGRSKDLPTL
ncbi:MAG: aldo/keto reductase [Polyangiaceae bacterium]|nr:aldo/keto reductase [Polyangiaceae bacterium]